MEKAALSELVKRIRESHEIRIETILGCLSLPKTKNIQSSI
ncbi:MAG: hypothetical protein K0Q75_2743 [Anaerospora sp.]|nr:hypothetical protein [Anaerospora sp.]